MKSFLEPLDCKRNSRGGTGAPGCFNKDATHKLGN